VTIHQFTVGMSVNGRPDRVDVDAEDALIAALRAKQENPAATITYVRRTNRRGDRRHPHDKITGRARPAAS
jgi:hypothetical protein